MGTERDAEEEEEEERRRETEAFARKEASESSFLPSHSSDALTLPPAKHVNNMKLQNTVMQLRKVCSHPFLFAQPDDAKWSLGASSRVPLVHQSLMSPFAPPLTPLSDPITSPPHYRDVPHAHPH